MKFFGLTLCLLCFLIPNTEGGDEAVALSPVLIKVLDLQSAPVSEATVTVAAPLLKDVGSFNKDLLKIALEPKLTDTFGCAIIVID